VQSTYSAVAAGLGVAFTIASTASVMTVPGVAHLPFDSPPPVFRHGVAWRSGTEASTVRDFLCVLEELAAQAAAIAANANGVGTAPPGRPRPARNGTAAVTPVIAALTDAAGLDGIAATG
jgi:hypothetical protein